ncbi:sigma-70 family RNA polymerase sigma factor [Pararhizobium sp.]|uniref:sigma-70 family RNA polymerase sigma factor n=1 Tax=Pararhizobium sp. TaxID=1977563 RepID=UPI00271DF888|nr:sigma-70 family RNA polymerase sigma factor [Pararhizobium sp.]MDO9416556.1 sigma-70 family RNA polymerase sigma factor [Pararhizobium sp.]
MDADRKQRFSALVKAVADARDRTAFTELFDFYAPRLKSFLMRQRMTAGEAEDLAQEVMVVLWHKASLYDPAKSSLSTWLFRIARNRSIDAARRKRRMQFDASDPLLQPFGDPLPDEGLETEDRERVVREALAHLPPDQIDLIRKAFFYGQSHTEIAAETGLPLGTVKSRIRLAFGKLRKLLDDAGVSGT